MPPSITDPPPYIRAHELPFYLKEKQNKLSPAAVSYNKHILAECIMSYAAL